MEEKKLLSNVLDAWSKYGNYVMKYGYQQNVTEGEHNEKVYAHSLADSGLRKLLDSYPEDLVYSNALLEDELEDVISEEDMDKALEEATKLAKTMERMHGKRPESK